MDIQLPALRREEVVALRLRALFEQRGYRLFRMGSFEEYDLYMQNKPFLMGEDIITFTSADGRLMALKPDVTLSIVKNTPAGETRRVYYTENVFRRSRQSGEYREISQMGLECIGGDAAQAEQEALLLAAQSLRAIGDGALDLSHMEFIGAVLAAFSDETRPRALAAMGAKSPHDMLAAAEADGMPAQLAARLARLAALAGEYREAIEEARSLTADIPDTKQPLDQLMALGDGLAKEGAGCAIRVDFSIINDTDYYNGLIFQGFISGVPRQVLAGGRYDNLLRRFGKPQGAVGFALYLDTLGTAEDNMAGPAGTDENVGADWLSVALPKGRMGEKVYKLFEQTGFTKSGVFDESRKLVFEDETNRIRYFLVKPGDVDIYVEHGAADIGVVGKDVLLESGADVLELLDMKLGKCRLAVAGPANFAEDPARPLRVATKYPAVARQYYAGKSRSVEIIKLHGSIELAPLTGLSDVIVDIVETGGTLRENNLDVLAEIEPSSARLVANRAAWRFKGGRMRTLVERLGEVL